MTQGNDTALPNAFVCAANRIMKAFRVSADGASNHAAANRAALGRFPLAPKDAPNVKRLRWRSFRGEDSVDGSRIESTRLDEVARLEKDHASAEVAVDEIASAEGPDVEGENNR